MVVTRPLSLNLVPSDADTCPLRGLIGISNYSPCVAYIAAILGANWRCKEIAIVGSFRDDEIACINIKPKCVTASA